MTKRHNNIKALHRTLLSWYRKYHRPFFWRNTANPYHILISEIMLQQTQASRVEEKLPAFLKKFPSFESLSHATTGNVLRAWQGMGYNNRAIRLRELSRQIVEQYNGKLPSDPEILQELPGIGRYTSHATACFAFRKRVPVVDINIKRVLSRMFWKMNFRNEMKDDNSVWDLAAEILPRDAYTWNQALMELGSVVCKAGIPLCDECPVTEYCASYKTRWNAPQAKRRVTKAKPEPEYAGIPQRMWRGKIVEALRNIHGKKMVSLNALGRMIKNDFTMKESFWLKSVVEKLEKDRVVTTKTRGRFLSVGLSEA